MFRHSLVVLVSVVALLSVGCSLRSHRVGMPDWGNVPQDLVDDVVQDTAVPADLIVPEDGVSQDLGDDVQPLDVANDTDGDVGEDVPDATLPDLPVPECTVAAECPAPSTLCMVAICLKGQCSEGALPEGTLPGDPVAGDCLQPKCLGNGAVISVANDTDVPADDGSPCTEEVCVGGEVAYGDAAPGTACGTNGVCNDQGQCVGCLVDADCPGVAGVCGWPVCTDGACGWTNLAEGTALPDDGTGDCRIPSCNGQGVEVWVTSTTDIPPDDLNPCTVEGCSPEGALLADPAPIGASCAYNGGALCDGAGNCVECVQNADCAAGVCTNHVCVPAPCADNTKNGDETDTDCGGSCPPCGAGKACVGNWDCLLGTCTGGVCV